MYMCLCTRTMHHARANGGTHFVVILMTSMTTPMTTPMATPMAARSLRNEMIHAANMGRVDVVRTMVDEQLVGDDYVTPCRCVLEAVCAASIVESSLRWGAPPIDDAPIDGFLDMVRAVDRPGSFQNAVHLAGFPLLPIAAAANHRDLVWFLIDNYVAKREFWPEHIRDQNMSGLFARAVANGLRARHVSLVQELLSMPHVWTVFRISRDDMMRILCDAVVTNDNDLLQFLTDKLGRAVNELGYDLNFAGQAVFDAAYKGDSRAVALLIGLEKWVVGDGVSMPSGVLDMFRMAVKGAVSGGHSNLLRLVFEWLPDFAKTSCWSCLFKSSLEAAVSAGRHELVKDLLQWRTWRWVPVDFGALTRSAVTAGQANVLCLLLDVAIAEGCLQVVEEDGFCEVLCFACAVGHVHCVAEVVQFLETREGAVLPLSLCARNGKALCTAINGGHLPVVQYLVEKAVWDDVEFLFEDFEVFDYCRANKSLWTPLAWLTATSDVFLRKFAANGFVVCKAVAFGQEDIVMRCFAQQGKEVMSSLLVRHGLRRAVAYAAGDLHVGMLRFLALNINTHEWVNLVLCSTWGVKVWAASAARKDDGVEVLKFCEEQLGGSPAPFFGTGAISRGGTGTIVSEPLQWRLLWTILHVAVTCEAHNVVKFLVTRLVHILLDPPLLSACSGRLQETFAVCASKRNGRAVHDIFFDSGIAEALVGTWVLQDNAFLDRMFSGLLASDESVAFVVQCLPHDFLRRLLRPESVAFHAVQSFLGSGTRPVGAVVLWDMLVDKAEWSELRCAWVAVTCRTSQPVEQRQRLRLHAHRARAFVPRGPCNCRPKDN